MRGCIEDVCWNVCCLSILVEYHVSCLTWVFASPWSDVELLSDTVTKRRPRESEDEQQQPTAGPKSYQMLGEVVENF